MMKLQYKTMSLISGLFLLSGARAESSGATWEEGARAQAQYVKAATAYRDSLQRLLAIYERGLASRVEQVETRRQLLSKGYVSKREVEESQRDLARLQQNVKETRLKIEEAEAVITEALGIEEAMKPPPSAQGALSQNEALARFNGNGSWLLSEANRIDKFFLDTFGRPLPVSALGQTEVHNKMGFDHRNAMDVALHPDSPEGRALIAYLRNAGIPFLAFQSKVAGAATGAHIHVGKPSQRIAGLDPMQADSQSHVR